jgi:radical SAM superfamily enzyme YgiQ (UPF0313 family)
MSEVRHLINKYGIRSFYFVDDDFLIPQSRFRSIATAMIDDYVMSGRKIRYSINSRATSVSPEILNIFRRSGGEMISFGFESGSQRVLNMLNKRSTVDDNVAAIRQCHDEGITVMGWIMVGNPGEVPSDLFETECFMMDNPIDHITVNLTTAFPGTTMWDYCQANKLIPVGHKWSDYNMSEVVDGWSPNADMSRAEIIGWFNRLQAVARAREPRPALSTIARMLNNDAHGVIRQAWKSRDKIWRRFF